jgi:hypothetical protein
MLRWLRADKGVTLAPDGSVAVWADQTGLGGRDATPFPGIKGPDYVARAYGPLPALHGDGTRSLLVNEGHGYPIGKQSSVFVVASGSTAGTSGVTFYNESTQGWQYAIQQTASGVHWINASSEDLDGGHVGSFTGAGTVPEDTFLFTRSPSPGLHMYAETQEDAVQATGYYDWAPVAWIPRPVGPSLYLMTLFGGPGDAFNEAADAGPGGFDPQGVVVSAGGFGTNGDILEIIQYGRELFPLEVAAVNAYLSSRWHRSAECPDGLGELL